MSACVYDLSDGAFIATRECDAEALAEAFRRTLDDESVALVLVSSGEVEFVVVHCKAYSSAQFEDAPLHPSQRNNLDLIAESKGACFQCGFAARKPLPSLANV